jgi:diaminopimelate epimerase
MDTQHIGGEQVGYVRLDGVPRLDMMGGEFCLNATRAFASVLDSLGLLELDGNVSHGLVEVSGVDEKVAVRITHGEGLPVAEACLHFESLPELEALNETLSIVRVPGITHLVQRCSAPERAILESFCAEQRRELSLEAEDAVGHLWMVERAGDPADSGTTVLALDPVVWVRATKTLCFESACGSGTLACALAVHARSGATQFSIYQPSGTPLSVRMERSENGWNVWVGGPSRITASGMTDLSGIL